MINVLLVDDQKVILMGTKGYIDSPENIQVIDTANDANEGLLKFKELKPDVLVVDLNMPGKSGITMIDELKKELSDTRVVILSGHLNQHYISQSMKLGINGVVSKHSFTESLETAIRCAARDEMFYCQECTEVIREMLRITKPLNTNCCHDGRSLFSLSVDK